MQSLQRSWHTDVVLYAVSDQTLQREAGNSGYLWDGGKGCWRGELFLKHGPQEVVLPSPGCMLWESAFSLAPHLLCDDLRR